MFISLKFTLYCDILIKPQEDLLHRKIQNGGLGLHKIAIRAEANLITSFVQANTANTPLERQTWESVRIDTLVAESPESCLNLKTEWGLSKNPSLVARGRPKVQETSGNQGKREKWEGRERTSRLEPAGKRKRVESPDRQAPTRKEDKHQTGANTPVGVKIRRLQDKINQGNKSQSIAQQIQPTLRSFIDLRGGLKGSQSRTGQKSTSESSSKAWVGQGP